MRRSNSSGSRFPGSASTPSLPAALMFVCGLAGCSTYGVPIVSPADAASPFMVAGGQQPVGNATVQIYAVGTAGDGSAATPLFAKPVTTNAKGEFRLAPYTCPAPNTPVYLVATGGDPGVGTPNPAIAMLDAIGPCSSLATVPSLVVNEITTVAGVWALAPFMHSTTEVGSSPSDAPALSAAFTLAANLASPQAGTTPGVGVPAGYTVPISTIDTVADILSACVNSTGGTAGAPDACGLLFSYAAASTGSAPTDTVDAALAIAQHPTVEVANLFAILPSNAPFQPQLTAPPASWTIALIPPTPFVPQPARLVFTTQPAAAVAGAPLTPAVAVAVEDSNGNPVPTATLPVTLALGQNPTGATLAGTLTATPVDGIATFPSLAVSAPGTYTLAATSNGLASATSLPFTVAAPPVQLPPVVARSAAAFVDSVGIDVHFNYYGSIYTGNTPLMISSLQALHITHLRDAMCWQGPQSWNTFYALHQQLGALGFKTDYVPAIDEPLSEIAVYPTLVPDMEAVEPANEYDLSSDPDWTGTIAAQQAAIYAAIKASYPNITVLAPSLAYPSDAAALGNVSAIADAGNLHGYFGGFNPGSSTINPSIYLGQVSPETPNEPVWVTETGYFAQPGPIDGTYGVSPAAQAIYSPRSLLEWWNAGVARTYLYELADDEIPGQNPAEYHWGLLNADGSAKPAFDAVANLLTLLSDPAGAPAFQPTALPLQLENADATVHRALFEKSDGSYYLALWIETSSYDFIHQVPVGVPVQNVTVNVGPAVAAASTTQWDASGNVTTTPLTPSQQLNVAVSDKLQIVKIGLK